MPSINLYSSRVHPRRIFPINSWVEGLSDYNKVGGSYLWARGIDYRTEESQITLLPASVLEAGQTLFTDLGKWAEQVVGRTVILGNNVNLITNGSFEVNTTGWTLGADYSRSSTKAYLGAFSIKQVSTSGSAAFTTPSGSGITVIPYTDYQLIFYTNVAVTSGSPSHLQINGGALTGPNLLISDTVLNDTATLWVPVTITFNSGSYSSIWINIFNNGGNLTGYYDAFSLVQINSLATFAYGNTGNIYKRYSNAAWVNLHTVPNSHGNGMAYYGEDDFLYYVADNTLGRYGPISSGTPTFVDDFLTAAGGVPTNTNSVSLIAANSDYAVKTTPSNATKITGDIAMEIFIKPQSLPAVGNSMTLMGEWTEVGNLRAYKFDILGISGYFGDGSNGALTISSNTTDAPIDAQCSGTVGTNQLYANNASFAAGQKILIHQTVGTGGVVAGTYQKTTIQSYDSTNHIITTTDNLNASYNSTDPNRAQVIVRKQYTNVTINSGVTLTAKAWNGTVGGIITFLANGTLTITGNIDSSACGFSGGPAQQAGASQVAPLNNGAVGGAGVNVAGTAAGSGAGHATAGQAAGGNPGGGTYDSSSGATVTFGSGGGGNGGIGNGGGTGGGWNFLTAVTITITGSIKANGQAGFAANSSNNGGGGGGAAGANSLECQTATLGAGLIVASGGLGAASGGSGATGGNGGDGYNHISYLTSYTGTSTPTITPLQDNTLVTSVSYQARIGISNDGTAFEYLTQTLKALSVGVWDRLQVSWAAASSTASFYENAALLGTSVGTKTAIFSSTADFNIGANTTTVEANFLDAYVNDARLWNTQRTAAQFAANNVFNLSGVSSGLVGNWFTTASSNDQVSGGNNLTLQGTPTPLYVTDVPYSGATTRLDIDQTSAATGFDYDLPTTLTESQSKSFVPTQDPQKSLQININAKGTGDWTLVVHDGLNRQIALVTVLTANLPSTGVYEFMYAAVFSPVVGATYHFHLYSTVNDGSIVCGADDDMTTAQFTSYYQFLVNDTEYHPCMQMLNVMAIGNGRYLAVQDAAGVYNARRLKFPAGWRVRSLATWRGYWAIGCWKGTTIKDFDQGVVFLWDGFSVTYNDFFYVPEGGVNAMYGENGVLYIIAGYKGDLLEYTGGDQAKKVKRIPKIGKSNYIEVAPGGMTYYQGLLRIAASYNSDSTTHERAIYTWGTLNETYAKSFSCDYPISTGSRGTTVKMGALVPVGGALLSFWQDNVSHGVDNMNQNNPVQTTGTIEELITDFQFFWKQKELLTVRADHLALRTGENIDVKYKADYEANWHNLGTTSQNIGDIVTRLPIVTPGLQYRALQIAVDLSATNGTSPTLLEHSQDTDLLLTNTDENAT